MQAVILVGGQGTRLRPLTETRPKPMMPLVDRPFVEHQVDQLKRHGITDIVFSCGYRPDAIEAYFGDGQAFGVTMRYVVDPVPLGTAAVRADADGTFPMDLPLPAVAEGELGPGTTVEVEVALPEERALLALWRRARGLFD